MRLGFTFRHTQRAFPERDCALFIPLPSPLQDFNALSILPGAVNTAGVRV